MNKKLRRLLQPGLLSYFIFLVLFASLSFLYEPILAAGELVVVLILYLIYRFRSTARRKEMIGYIETVTHHVDSVANDTMVNFPLPMLIVSLDSDEIIWANASFINVSGLHDSLFTHQLKNIVPELNLKWLLEGKDEHPGDILLNGRSYRIYGNLVRPTAKTQAKNSTALLAMLYWLDTTELRRVKQVLADTRPVFGIIMIDNYDEIVKNTTESAKSSLLAAIDDRIVAWLEHTGAFLRRYDRDRYAFSLNHAELTELANGKFTVLDSVRELISPSGVPVTLSIGVGIHENSFRDSFAFASLAIDMALARGGDQTVIKDQLQFSFYGGHSKELEKRTKVKSRIVANTLKELIVESDRVLVMGHKNSDIDSVGAACGIVTIARALNKQAQIVIDQSTTAAIDLINRLKEQPEYESVFIAPQDAIINATAMTLLVVVDTCRTDFVESPELLQSLNHIAVIDHHRRAATYIERAALSFHEPYASSASELVTELMMYLVEPTKLSRVEAEALLGGIVLDTKSFSMHTGVRTFEAAAFLRSAGADSTAVKKLFQTDMSESMIRYNIINKATVVHDNVAIAALEQAVPQTIAAQAADELLDIRNISASFVLSPQNGSVYINARSLDQINVQVICEKLGGGGHMTIAGAQLPDTDIQTAVTQLMSAIDRYYEEAGDPV